MRRKDFDANDSRIFRLWTWRACGDPLRKHPIIEGVRLETFPPLVWDGACGLEEHQAEARVAGHNAAAKGAMSEREKITFVVITAQRKLESVLAGRRAMAGARAATIFGQNRLYMVAKTPFEGFIHRLNRDWGGCRLLACCCANGRCAVFCRDSDAILNSHNIGIAGNEFDPVGDWSNELVVAGFFEDKLLSSAGAG